MAYVSDYLTHFVGRSQANDRLRYELLATIIRGGVLLDPQHIGRRDPIFQVRMVPKSTDSGSLEGRSGLDYSSYPNARHNAARLSDNTVVEFEIVCFCDIPESELAIHCAKYSRFGLAFTKQFLIAQGASPVMYVPKPGWFKMILRSHDCISGELDRELPCVSERAKLIDDTFEFHDRSLTLERFRYLQEQMSEAFRNHESVEDVLAVERRLQEALLYKTAIEALIFSHLKFFDPTLPPDHAENYYMEREWRVSGKVEFTEADIAAVYVPQEIVPTVAQNFPQLAERVASISV